MTDRRTLRAPAGLFWLVGVAVLALFLLGDVVVRGSWSEALLLAPWLLAPVWFVYVLFFAPRLELDDERVRVHNVLRRIDLPWTAVAEIAMRWQLEFRLTPEAAATGAGGRRGIVQAWSVSRRQPRRGLGRRADPSEQRSQDSDETLRVIRELHAAAQPGAGAARPTVSWDVPAIAAAGVIVAWAVAAVLVAR